MRVDSMMRRMKRSMDSRRPSSIAMVRSKSTVRKKVTASTAISLFGPRSEARTERHPLMLYEMTTSTPERQAIGM